MPIFVDTNVPMYAAGGLHPLKEPCKELVLLASAWPLAFFTDAEVLRELIHVYRSRGQWTEGKDVFENFIELMRERIEPLYAEDVQAASSLAGRYPRLSARDFVHLAIMIRVGSRQIASADQGFDGIAAIQRLDPLSVAAWRHQIATP